jgi:type IV fimbrial biogenesis protein FimT
MTSIQSKSGFSLLEILITLSIIGTLLAFVLPAYHLFQTTAASDALSDQLLRAIQLGNSEAIARNTTITLCKSQNHTTCGGTWESGQILFIDTNQNGIVSDTSQILFVFDKAHAGVLHWRPALNQEYLQFSPEGMTHGQHGTFLYCLKKYDQPLWAIIINGSGRARKVDGATSGLSCR